MRPVYVNATQTSGATGVSSPVPLDVNIAPFNVSYSVTNISGSIKATVQVTDDNVFAVGFDASAANWFGQASAANISAATMGFLTGQPVVAIRLSLASGVYSGGATLTVIQGE